MKKINIVLQNKKSLGMFLVFGLVVLSLMMTGDVSASSYTLTLTSSGSQDINLSASAGTAISSDAINVATTCRYGYNFTINTSVSDNNLYLGGDSSNNTEGTYFSPTDGTTALNATTNKWGYYYNASTAPTNTSVFSPVPTLSSPATVKTPLTTPASSDINDNFNIYYGVSSSPTMSKGTYKMIPDANNSNNDGTIVYTATMAENCIRYTVQFSPTSEFEGNTLSGTGTMNDQTIYEGVATALTSNGFTAPSGYYFAGWNTAQDDSGTSYSDGQNVTDLTTAGNTITLYAMWDNCPGGKICYIANGTNIVGTMGKQDIASTDTSATLYTPNFKRDGYGFAAWNTAPDGSGTNYGPNQTIQFTAGAYSANGLKLYATWIASAGNMQNWSGCSSMSQGDVIALKDTRDDDVYAVAKLADGKCWMIENLRLADKDGSNNDVNLSSANTHNPSLPLKNIYDSNTTSNHLSPTSSVAYNSSTAPEGWCQANSSACDNQSRLRTDNTVLFTDNISSSYNALSTVYSYGNYYNWYSATAGHGKYGNSYGSGYTAPGDICPAGWHLPTGTSRGEYYALNTAINAGSTSTSAGLRTYPANFVYSGAVHGETIYYRNSRGCYWSASGNDDNYAHTFLIENTNTSPGTDHDDKYYGRTVRCIAGV